MDPASSLLLTGLIFIAALLYSSVGHGGASGYLAAMALFMVPSAVMKPSALTLNILVASIGTFKYVRAGSFSPSVFWPLALVSVPFAFIGGWITLPSDLYRPLVGLVLLYAAGRSLFTAGRADDYSLAQPSRYTLPATGAGIGLLSGLTGVGGGIFLSPLLIFCRWATVRQASGIAAAFILVNSIAGLLGHMLKSPTLPAALPWWGMAAIAGGYVGAEYGSRRLGNPTIQRLLGLVLVVAGGKMIFT